MKSVGAADAVFGAICGFVGFALGLTFFEGENLDEVVLAFVLGCVLLGGPLVWLAWTARSRATSTERKREQIQGLSAAALAMTSAPTIEDALQTITDHARAIIGAQYAVVSVALVGGGRGLVRRVSASSDLSHLGDQWEPIEWELDHLPRLRPGRGRESPRAWLAAPLLSSRGANLGMIQLSHPHAGHFTDADLELLVQLCRMAGAAVEIRTAKDELEARVRERTSELARSNAELEQFAYVASHDLQEPLRMVRAYTELLAHRYQDRLGDDGREFIGYAVDGATRMQRLINDLLSYSRVGRREMAIEPVDASEAAREAVLNLQVSVTESDAEIRLDPLPRVRADQSQLVQLFQNLISNAIRFAGDEPPRVHVSAHPDEEVWVFEVRDRGIGFEPAFAERIFEVFQRLNGKGAYSDGTGIGLAICRRIAERHGGRIWAESQPGRGATFRFTMPAQPTNETQ